MICAQRARRKEATLISATARPESREAVLRVGSESATASAGHTQAFHALWFPLS